MRIRRVLDSFQGRLLLFMLVLALTVQSATFLAVWTAGRTDVQERIDDDLQVGARVVQRQLESRGEQLARSVQVLGLDFGFRQAVATGDRETVMSALGNVANRVDADASALTGLDLEVVVTDLPGISRGERLEVPPRLLEEARRAGQAAGLVVIGDRLYQVAMAPVKAPLPLAWVVMGFRVDRDLLAELGSLTLGDVSFWWLGEGEARRLASSRPEETADLGPVLAGAEGGAVPEAGVTSLVRLGRERHLVYPVHLFTTEDGAAMSPVRLVLHSSVSEAMGSFRRLSWLLLALSLLGLLCLVVGSVTIARGVTRPVRQLVSGARRIAGGDYSEPIAEPSSRELGTLARAFNHMVEGVRERERKIVHQSLHDALTGLPNRELFRDRLQHGLAAARRRGSMVAVLLLDLDRFKEINDSLGHHAGDLLLQQVGERVRQTVREADTVARLGGDEFAVMVSVDDADAAVTLGQRIQDVLAPPFDLGDFPIEVGASLGVALFPLHGDDDATLLQKADMAMYLAKESHSSLAVYEPRSDEPSLRRLALMSDFRRAAAEDELVLYFQPKVGLADDTILHAEALVRWQHPQYGLLPPGEFIPLAEQTGHIRLLTRWSLREAIRQCRRWLDQGLRLSVAVNLSALDLLDASLPAVVADLLREHDVAADLLLLELTESAVMREPTHVRRVLTELERLGVRLAVDDFGTGYSSLSHLRRLPVHEIKIDKSFVLQMATDRDDLALVKSTIQLAHNLGLQVVAEGVETLECLELLRMHDCDMVQGYYFTRPLPPTELTGWLAERAAAATVASAAATSAAPTSAGPTTEPGEREVPI
jgi:diguanylate cyclase (GGDEF)-like protein